MLRINAAAEEGEEIVLEVEGWVAGAGVELLRREGAPYLRTGYRLVLDLEGVRFLDPKGLALLEEWSGEQLELRGGSPFIRMLLRIHGLI